MKTSARARGVIPDGDDGWGVLMRARAMEREGLPVVNLSIGEHDAATPRLVVDALAASARAGNTRYAAHDGSAELRAAVAGHVSASTGAGYGADDVIVTCGGQGALWTAFQIALDPGDAAVIVDPGYTTYPGTIRAAQGEVRVVEARAEDGFQPRAEALDAACAGARALLVNTPNNPTGAVYSAATIAAIADVCRRHDLWLVSDEVYDTMVWRGVHRSPAAAPGMRERTMVVGSLSKSHAMTGFRLGWLAAPREVVDLAGDLALNNTYGLPGFVQDAGLAALRAGPGLIEEVVAPFRRRATLAAEVLAGAPAVRLSAAEGAMYAMVDVRAAGLPSRVFADRLLEEELIAVTPGDSFGTAAEGHVRVALTLPDDALAEALRRLAAFAARAAAAAA